MFNHYSSGCASFHIKDFKHFVNTQPTVRFAGFKEGKSRKRWCNSAWIVNGEMSSGFEYRTFRNNERSEFFDILVHNKISTPRRG